MFTVVATGTNGVVKDNAAKEREIVIKTAIVFLD